MEMEEEGSAHHPLLGAAREDVHHHHRDKELGSDGETSDYQRSTPSPRDATSRIKDLIAEGLVTGKSDDDHQPAAGSTAPVLGNPGLRSTWLSSVNHHQLSPPDLGFVDDCSNDNNSVSSTAKVKNGVASSVSLPFFGGQTDRQSVAPAGLSDQRGSVAAGGLVTLQQQVVSRMTTSSSPRLKPSSDSRYSVPASTKSSRKSVSGVRTTNRTRELTAAAKAAMLAASMAGGGTAVQQPPLLNKKVLVDLKKLDSSLLGAIGRNYVGTERLKKPAASSASSSTNSSHRMVQSAVPTTTTTGSRFLLQSKPQTIFYSGTQTKGEVVPATSDRLFSLPTGSVNTPSSGLIPLVNADKIASSPKLSGSPLSLASPKSCQLPGGRAGGARKCPPRLDTGGSPEQKQIFVPLTNGLTMTCNKSGNDASRHKDDGDKVKIGNSFSMTSNGPRKSDRTSLGAVNSVDACGLSVSSFYKSRTNPGSEDGGNSDDNRLAPSHVNGSPLSRRKCGNCGNSGMCRCPHSFVNSNNSHSSSIVSAASKAFPSASHHHLSPSLVSVANLHQHASSSSPRLTGTTTNSSNNNNVSVKSSYQCSVSSAPAASASSQHSVSSKCSDSENTCDAVYGPNSSIYRGQQQGPDGQLSPKIVSSLGVKLPSAISSSSPSSCDSNVLSSSAPSSGGAEAGDSASNGQPAERKFRYPTLAAQYNSAIPCKWEGCEAGFKTYGKLSDHIKTVHMLAQLELEDDQSGGSTVLQSESTEDIKREYSCLWRGCKVYGKKSSSRSWLEKHVPLHGGKLAFACIVEGCRMRFSSQVILQRHVNSHFRDSSPGNSQAGGPRKSSDGAPARKVLKKAGVKLKIRKLPFSARIFDFFDAGLMAGLRHTVTRVEQTGRRMGLSNGHTVEFTSRVMGRRVTQDGGVEVRIKWLPEDMLPDEWVPLQEAQSKKTLKLSQLPEDVKQRLQHDLLLRPPSPPSAASHSRCRASPPRHRLQAIRQDKEMASLPQSRANRRKARRTPGPNPFMTPQELRSMSSNVKLESIGDPNKALAALFM